MDDSNHHSEIDRLMLRFRPIAPRPAAGDTHDGRIGPIRRTKRKYVRVRVKKTKPSEKSEVKDSPSPERSEVTLQLPPVMISESGKRSCYSSIADRNQYRVGGGDVVGCGTAATWIVVERVTDTYADLGMSDAEMMKNLEGDTCPSFVTDAANKVVWVNDAYRRTGAEKEMVRLVVGEEQLAYFTPSFACRVRMIQQTKQGQKRNRIVACDVWRIGAFAFAWKLDLQTAIGLGV